jgi:hypothetical protein
MEEPFAQFNKAWEQAGAFQKLWLDNAAKMTGVLSQYSPAAPPLEEARRLRTAMFKALGESCEEFMRTPQFMEAMKGWINASLELRRMQRAGMDGLHDQFDTPDKEDIDGILLTIRHSERRILDRLEELEEKIDAMKSNA